MKFAKCYNQSKLSRLMFMTCNNPPRGLAYTPEVRKRWGHTKATKLINVAGLMIGDEILSCKVRDENSAYLARKCYERGLRLNRIEIIGDEEHSIVKTVRRLSDEHDMVITSGGVGPTHDDITFKSIAKAFGMPLDCDSGIMAWQLARIQKLKSEEATRRNMRYINSNNEDGSCLQPLNQIPKKAVGVRGERDRESIGIVTEIELQSLKKTATVPAYSKQHYVGDEFWTPVVITNNVCTFPGVPRLFSAMLDQFIEDYKRNKLAEFGFGFDNKASNANFFTKSLVTHLCEHDIFLDLTKLQDKYKDDVKIGSYPNIDSKKLHKVVLTVDGNNQDSVTCCYNELLSLIHKMETRDS